MANVQSPNITRLQTKEAKRDSVELFSNSIKGEIFSNFNCLHTQDCKLILEDDLDFLKNKTFFSSHEETESFASCEKENIVPLQNGSSPLRNQQMQKVSKLQSPSTSFQIQPSSSSKKRTLKLIFQEVGETKKKSSSAPKITQLDTTPSAKRAKFDDITHTGPSNSDISLSSISKSTPSHSYIQSSLARLQTTPLTSRLNSFIPHESSPAIEYFGQSAKKLELLKEKLQQLKRSTLEANKLDIAVDEALQSSLRSAPSLSNLTSTSSQSLLKSPCSTLKPQTPTKIPHSTPKQTPISSSTPVATKKSNHITPTRGSSTPLKRSENVENKTTRMRSLV